MSNVGCLRVFSPSESDWTIYKEQLNQYFVINGIKEEAVKRAILLNMCNETAYQLINSLCLPAKPETEEYKSLVKLFDKHFTAPKLTFPEREAYYECKKNKDESVQEWAARIRQLAGKCDFKSEELETALRDRFVCGFPKGPVKERLFEETPEKLTFEKAIEIASNKEASYRKQEVTVKTEHEAYYLRKVKGKYQSQEAGRPKPRQEGGSREYQYQQPRRERPIQAGHRSSVHFGTSTSSSTSTSGMERKTGAPCDVCGKEHPPPCRYRNCKCHICGMRGHLASKCKQIMSKSRETYKQSRNNFLESTDDIYELYTLNTEPK